MGLMDFRARSYSVTLGRFLSADTIVPGAGNPQAFNRYAYVHNNPINHSDPTGHCADGITTIVCLAVGGALLGGIIGGVTYALSVPAEQQNFGDAVAAIGVGAVGGALAGAGIAVAAVAAISGAGAVAVSATMADVAAFSAVTTGAGTGIIGSQLGYTIGSGASYATSKMAVAASVGAVSGALNGLADVTPGAGAPFKLGMAPLYGAAQTGLTNLFDSDPDTQVLDGMYQSAVYSTLTAGISEIVGSKVVNPKSPAVWDRIGAGVLNGFFDGVKNLFLNEVQDAVAQ